MIITQTPLRISFAGGGTDLAAYYAQREGFVVSTAIDKFVYVLWLLPRDHEQQSSAREHQPTREQTPGCKRSPANDDVRLAILPYGRYFELDSRDVREVALRQMPRSGSCELALARAQRDARDLPTPRAQQTRIRAGSAAAIERTPGTAGRELEQRRIAGVVVDPVSNVLAHGSDHLRSQTVTITRAQLAGSQGPMLSSRMRVAAL